MSTLELFLIIAAVLILMYLASRAFSNPKEISRDEDNAFNRIALSREILKKVASPEVALKYEQRIMKCEEMFNRRNFSDAQKCADSVLEELRNLNLKKDENEVIESNIICNHCGTKLAKKYEFCPICGEKL